ncbi:hypothetical protein AB0B48_02000 [Micromonospora sp. NPDC049089]|uniref:hypothetical protein n=1 Tax=Micromonospora sp. NPDC049089 TaxID=3155496 RepID=UPI003404E765
MWTEITIAGLSIAGTLGAVGLTALLQKRSSAEQRRHERSLHLVNEKRTAYSQFEQFAYLHADYVRAYKDAFLLLVESAFQLTEFVYKYRSRDDIPEFFPRESWLNLDPDMAPHFKSLLGVFLEELGKVEKNAAERYPIDASRKDDAVEVRKDNDLLLEVVGPLAARAKTLPAKVEMFVRTRQQFIEADQTIRLLGSEQVREAAKPIYSAIASGAERDELQTLMGAFLDAARKDLCA